MNNLTRNLIFILAIAAIAVLFFLAFWVFVIALLLAPLAYIINYFYKPKVQKQESAKPDANVINAEYEVINNEDNTTK